MYLFVKSDGQREYVQLFTGDFRWTADIADALRTALAGRRVDKLVIDTTSALKCPLDLGTSHFKPERAEAAARCRS